MLSWMMLKKFSSNGDNSISFVDFHLEDKMSFIKKVLSWKKGPTPPFNMYVLEKGRNQLPKSNKKLVIHCIRISVLAENISGAMMNYIMAG